MGVLKLIGFSGRWPLRDPQVLPDNAAVVAVNVFSDGGGYLRGLPSPAFVMNLAIATNFVVRLPSTTAGSISTSGPVPATDWAQFADTDTTVVRGPVSNDQFERVYWCSPSTGLRVATRSEAVSGVLGSTPGVPTNASAGPTVVPVAGTGAIDPATGNNTGILQTRSYLQTFINQWGEESAPTKTTEAVGYHDQTWRITTVAPSSLVGFVNVTKTRIYRTVTGENGVTGFYKVVDLSSAAAGQVYNDTLLDLTVSGQGVIESTAWIAPPSGLQGIVALPNGILVGWKEHTLFFSENFRPHAWPDKYAITVEHPIVGVGVFGNTAVVCTSGPPYMVSGTKARAMSLAKTDAPMPCSSRGSIAGAPYGVFYASQDGLVLVSPKGIELVTTELIGRDTWRNEFQPWSMQATFYNGHYVATYGGASGKAFALRPDNPTKEGVVVYQAPPVITKFGMDDPSGQPWIIGADHKLYEWARPDQPPLTYTWQSKPLKLPAPTNFSVFQVYYDDAVSTPPHMRLWVTLRGNDGTVSRQLIWDATLPASGNETRLPSGFRSDVWEVEFTGVVPIQTFIIATSAGELRGA